MAAFLPSESEIVDPFWRSMVRSLISGLQTTACWRSDDGEFCLPTQLLIRPSLCSSDLLSSSELFKAIGMRFLCSDELGQQQALLFGIPKFGTSDLVKWLQHKTDASKCTLSWFESLYDLIFSLFVPTNVDFGDSVDKLTSLNIFPVYPPTLLKNSYSTPASLHLVCCSGQIYFASTKESSCDRWLMEDGAKEFTRTLNLRILLQPFSELLYDHPLAAHLGFRPLNATALGEIIIIIFYSHFASINFCCCCCYFA